MDKSKAFNCSKRRVGVRILIVGGCALGIFAVGLLGACTDNNPATTGVQKTSMPSATSTVFTISSTTVPSVSPIPTVPISPSVTPEPTLAVKKEIDLREWGMGPLLNMSDSEWGKILANSEIPKTQEDTPLPWLVGDEAFWRNQLSGKNPKLGATYAENRGIEFPINIVSEFVGFYPLVFETTSTDYYTEWWLIAMFRASDSTAPEKDNRIAFAFPYIDKSISLGICAFGAYEENTKKLVLAGAFTSSPNYGGLTPQNMAKFFIEGRKYLVTTTLPDKSTEIGAKGKSFKNGKALCATKFFMLGVDTVEDVEQIIGKPTGYRK